MTGKDYIIELINKWANLFENIGLRYAYDTKTRFHIIEVTPELIRRGNNDFIKEECEVNQEFSCLFPDEDLLITEPNILTESIPTEYIIKRDIIVCDVQDIEHSFNVIPWWNELQCTYLLAA